MKENMKNLAVAISRYRRMINQNMSIVQRRTASNYGRLIWQKLETLSASQRKEVLKMAENV